MKNIGFAMLIAGVLTAASGLAGAAQVPIYNHSFEATTLSPGGSSYTVLGWDWLNAATILRPTTSSGIDGYNAGALGTTALLNHNVMSDETDTAAGVIPLLLAANTTYTLTFSLGGRDQKGDGGAVTAYFYSGVASNHPWDNGYDTVLMTVPVTGLVANNVLANYSGSFTSASSVVANSLHIVFRSTSATGQSLLDNVRLDATPAPEPATMSLLALGALGIVRRRKN